ncbi:MAG: hypothetical protein JXQ73_19630 [Phycisphaerae bacterium]|nr:hypothetical protein [Phycisphaerae bacterium]
MTDSDSSGRDDSAARGRGRPRARAAAPWIALAGLLLLGLGVRIYLAGTPGYPFDLNCFYAWADAAHRGDLRSPYQLKRPLPCNYPPGYILVISRLPWLYELLTGETFRTPPDPNSGKLDEVDLALEGQYRRRDWLKKKELIEHYRREDPEVYRAITEALPHPELVLLGLVPREQFAGMREAYQRDPERYKVKVQRLAAGIQSMLAKGPPYTAPDRLRRLAVWVKLPALLCDLAGAGLLYVLLRKRRGRWGALLVSGVYLFLPAVLYDSACWGQVDGVHSLAMLGCVALLVAGHSFLVGLLFAVALLTKFQSIVIAPVLAAGFLARWSATVKGSRGGSGGVSPEAGRRVLGSMGLVLLGVVVGAGVVLTPFAADGAAGDALGTYGKVAGQYHWVSVCAFNPWWLLNSKPDVPKWYYRFTRLDDKPWLGPVTPKHVGLGMLGGFSLWIMWLVFRRGCGYEVMAAGAAAMAMGFFVLPTEIHERYGFPAMILCAYLVGAGWRYLPVLLVLSVAQLYNFTAVQPMDDPRYAWLMPIANAVQGHGGITYLFVLIHVACLVYFCVVLYQIPVRSVAFSGVSTVVAGPGRRSERSRRSSRKGRPRSDRG